MPVIKPSVGRVLLFVPKDGKYEFGFCFRGDDSHAAVVTAVHGDRCVNLAAFDANGKSYGFTSVTLVQPGDEIPAGDYCTWMPYQVGKAAAGDNNSESAEPRPR